MNVWAENTFELLKVFHMEEFLDLKPMEFARVMQGYHDGRYELIIVVEEKDE